MFLTYFFSYMEDVGIIKHEVILRRMQKRAFLFSRLWIEQNVAWSGSAATKMLSFIQAVGLEDSKKKEKAV